MYWKFLWINLQQESALYEVFIETKLVYCEFIESSDDKRVSCIQSFSYKDGHIATFFSLSEG